MEKLVIVKNRSGIHTRPAAMLVKLTSKFKSNIFFVKDGYEINAKSIIGVMTLAAEQGSEILLQINGIDEEQAIADISALFDSGFGEV